MSDETATQQQLYCCTRCSQALGPPTEDGRIEIVLEGGDVWRVVSAVLDCACGVRQPVRRLTTLPPFVKEWYPNGAEPE